MDLPPLAAEHLGLIGTIGTCACGDRQIITAIARDADTREPVLVHHSLDLVPDLYFVSGITDSWPRGPWHIGVSRNAAQLLNLVPPLAGKVYRHFKGTDYGVLRAGYDVRVGLKMVVIYQSIHHWKEEPWVRLYDEGPSPWLGTVDIEGVTRDRFTLLENRIVYH